MASEATVFYLGIVQFACAALSLLALLRIGYILSANPIGEFTQELVYLRLKDLRQSALAVFAVVLLEVAESVVPFLVSQGWLGDVGDVVLFSNTAQAFLVTVAAVLALLVVSRYTHRALDRRIRESMETLAYLEGQRRRRRQVERGEWTARDEE